MSVPATLGLLAVAAVYVVMALDHRDLAGLGAWCFAGAFALLAAALVRVTLPARGDVPDDATRIRGSLALAGTVSLAVVLAVGGVAAWIVLLVTESRPGGLGVGGAFVLMVLGALGALGAGWRVVTGRTRLWRVDLDGTALHYRGGRTTRSIAWTDVGSVAVTEDRRHVVVRSRRDEADPLRIPTLAFDVPALRILAVVERAHAKAVAGRGVTRRNPRRRGG